jgi:S-DNA-T family DNA segregation ATPase FtsK/SpoIIIE
MPKKKKKSSSSEAKNTDLLVDLKGIGLVLIALIGCLPFGIVAEIIRGFAAFLVGDWWALLLILVGICGLYMIFTRKKPVFLTAKLLGLYIIIFAVLTMSHLSFLKEYQSFKLSDTPKVLDETTKSIVTFIKSGKSFTLSPNVGGGMIGALLASLLVALLTVDGTVVVSIALIICGLIMFTGVSLYDALRNTKDKMHTIKESLQNSVRNSSDDDDEDEEDEIEVTDVSDNEDHRTVIKREEIHSKPEITVAEVKEETETPQVVAPISSNTESEDDEVKQWEYPPLSLLTKASKNNNKENQDQIKHNIPILVQVLRDFGIEGKVVSAHVGPSVTQYELEIKAGTRVNKILSLNREIALNLAAKDVRIQAPIPGKSTIGVELPNRKITMVTVREILASAQYNGYTNVDGN